jgi:hypothetical protein
MKNANTITQVYNNYSKKTKNVLYLVLQKKSLEQKVIDDLEKELETKMLNFLKKIEPKLQNTNFENPEASIKLVLLKGFIKILEKMIKDKFGQLSEHDQNLINEIMNGEEKKNNKEEDIKDEKNNKDDSNNNQAQKNPINEPKTIIPPKQKNEANPSNQIPQKKTKEIPKSKTVGPKSVPNKFK